MGVKGTGGRRVGAGRKPKSQQAIWLSGSRGNVKSAGAPAGGSAPVATVKRPPGMMPAERKVWRALAPHALRAKTLAPATAEAFRDLCRLVVRRNQVDAEIARDGLVFRRAVHSEDGELLVGELTKHPLLTDLRGLEQLIAARRKDFALLPFGKELEQPDEDMTKELSTLAQLQANTPIRRVK